MDLENIKRYTSVNGASPAWVFLLAFTVVLTGITVRFVLGGIPIDDPRAWLVQGTIVFPISAWIATAALGLTTSFSDLKSKLTGRLGNTLVFIVHYALISAISCIAFNMTFWEQGFFDSFVVYGTYIMLSGAARPEFIVFAALLLVFSVLKIGSPIENMNGKRGILFHTALPVIAVLVMAMVTPYSGFLRSVKDQVEIELTRIGHFIPSVGIMSSGETQEANRSAIEGYVRDYEDRLDMKVTGKPSRKILKYLKSRSTKLDFTLNSEDGDFRNFADACEHISNISKYNLLTPTRESTSRSHIEVKLSGELVLTEPESCFFSSLDQSNVRFMPNESSNPTRIVFKDNGALNLSASDADQVLVSGLTFYAVSVDQPIIVLNTITFEKNTVEVGRGSNSAYTVNAKDSNLLANKLINGLVMSSGSSSFEENHFIDQSRLEVRGKKATVSLKRNYFKAMEGVAITVMESAKAIIEGKIYLKDLTIYPLLHIRDEATVRFKDGSIAAPQGAGCIAIFNSARLDASDVEFGPCGSRSYSIFFDSTEATANIRNSTFKGRGININDYFNVDLEDTVLSLENSSTL